jgi:hypothetical protein
MRRSIVKSAAGKFRLMPTSVRFADPRLGRNPHLRFGTIDGAERVKILLCQLSVMISRDSYRDP